jgi:hypothetical protein
MIAQVLNRQFVLEQLEMVEAELAQPPDQRRSAAESLPGDASAADFQAAWQELTAAREKEAVESSGQRGYDATGAERRGEAAAPIDDTVFISHDPHLSILQSALDQYFEERAADQIEDDTPADDGRRGGSRSDFVAVTPLKIAGNKPRPSDLEGRRVFNKFSETDPRWVASLFAMGARWFRKRHPFNPKPADPVKIRDNARLIIVGDWGSGLPRAVAIGKQMRKVLEQGRASGLEQHVVHLGDVYYSGWQREYEKRFLPSWPVRAEEAGEFGSWNLNGNHDMYAGGHAYFDFLLAEPRFAKQQRSSFFSLGNAHWDILGLDTAYQDEGLEDPQADWVAQSLGNSSRKSMLLSHHQLFSAYEQPSEPLRKKIGPFLERHPVDVWFWGHEHRCVFYREHRGVKNARLIGNGGVPVYMKHREDEPLKEPAIYEYRKFIDGGLEKWAYFGFAVVDLHGEKAKVRYIDEFGTEFKNEEL